MNNEMTVIFYVSVAVMNIATFIMYGIDKKKAIDHKWRIPESTLIGMSFAFGSLGALIGMRVFRHKTKHIKFRILIPLAFVLHIIIIYFYIKFLVA